MNIMTSHEFFGTDVASRQFGVHHLTLRDYAPHTRLPQHAHGEAFATVIVRGGFQEKSRGRSLSCATHDVVVHAAGERHADHFGARDTRCLSVQGAKFDRTALLSSALASSIAVKLIHEFCDADALSPMVIEAMMLELFVASARTSDEHRMPAWLPHLRTTIEERFQEPLTLADLAQDVGIHPGHVARAFRRHYHTTVGDLLRELRVRYAMQCLQSARPLAEIAQDAGFADQSHLTRTFRRATGMTPWQYRRTFSAF
jgi:AraC family transcriptional regulator